MKRFTLLWCVGAWLTGAWLTTDSAALGACVSDSDADGICDTVLARPGTPAGALVGAFGRVPGVPGDYDRDGDVDLQDLDVMIGCLLGPATSAAPSCPADDFDFDADSDIDMADFAAFQRCFSGADQPGDPDCVSHVARIEAGCLQIIGTAADTLLALRLWPGLPHILGVDVGDDGVVEFAFNRGEFNCIIIDARGGNDLVRMDESNGAFTDTESTTIYGGGGDDTLVGGRGGETIFAGDGHDFVEGNGGSDIAFLGDGDDTSRWDPGDGSDVIEGQSGFDLLVFNGSNVGEILDLSAVGGRLRLVRNVGSVTMDCEGVERVQFHALGGADVIVINDLGGTAVVEVTVDLALPAGSATGDAQPDTVIAQGTAAADTILVYGSAGSGVSVLGLAAALTITGSEVANDRIQINALAGDDVVDASELAAGAIGLQVDGGADDDVLIGSDGNDVLLGGEGDDVLLGGPGLDVLDGGPGDNIVIQ